MLKFKIHSFEKLNAWKETRKLVVKVYQVTSHFPPEEKFGLTSQMRRAVISVSNNLSEGTSRSSLRDQARFTEISFGSLIELIDVTIHSLDLGFISVSDYTDLRIEYDKIGPMIDGLRKSQVLRNQTNLSKNKNP